MAYDYNAKEVFEMAVKIEENGAAFYRVAAKGMENPESKKFLLDLAVMEDGHEKTFAGMKKSLTATEKASTVFDPNGEAASYLKALADTRVFFEKEIDVTSMKAILKSAITAEKDSIVFYLGMKDMVTSSHGKDHINAIIKEEMKHIRLLSNRLLVSA